MTTCRCFKKLPPSRVAKLCAECDERYRRDVAYDHAQDSHALMLAALGTEVKESGSFTIHPTVRAKERRELERQNTPRGAVATVRAGRLVGHNRVYDWTRVRHEVSI